MDINQMIQQGKAQNTGAEKENIILSTGEEGKIQIPKIGRIVDQSDALSKKEDQSFGIRYPQGIQIALHNQPSSFVSKINRPNSVLNQQQFLEKQKITYSQHIFKELYLDKYKMIKSRSLKASHRDDTPKNINSNGIVSIYSLAVIFILICFSIAHLSQCNKTFWPHVKGLADYFTITVLAQDDLSIYDMGDNIDEPSVELLLFEDIEQHFERICGFVGNYSKAGFVKFFNQEKESEEKYVNLNRSQDIVEKVSLELYFYNGKFQKRMMSFQEFRQFFEQEVDLREYLLQLKVLEIQISFGDTKLIDDFKLAIDYQVYSHAMLIVQLSTQWRQKELGDQAVRISDILRFVEQVCSGILLTMYFIQARKLYYNISLQKQFRKNSLYWCGSLIFLNFTTMTSSTLAPMCSVLQLLPILENHDSSNTLTYNFNVNLRYAAPLAFSAFIQIYIIVNGFIFYSMIMYPGEYFDDYLTSFFSYFYNNYQYGIYQIFTELKDRGNLAYFLYVILYFYMVLVGGNLVPALFCILILRKMAERELIRYVESKLEQVACPSCLHENYKKDIYSVQLSIKSPKSPYLQSGTVLKTPKQKTQNKIAKMFIEDQEKNSTISPLLSLTNKHKKVRHLVGKIQEYFEQSFQNRSNRPSKEWLERRLRKAEEVKKKIDEIHMKRILGR